MQYFVLTAVFQRLAMTQKPKTKNSDRRKTKLQLSRIKQVRGLQIVLAPRDYIRAVNATVVAIVKSK